jgi:hypothetical protein
MRLWRREEVKLASRYRRFRRDAIGGLRLHFDGYKDHAGCVDQFTPPSWTTSNSSYNLAWKPFLLNDQKELSEPNMKKNVVLTFATLFWLMTPAHAERMAASCPRLLSISSEEATLVYYDAEGDLGRETADRLWAAYHRLRNQCANKPHSQVVVNVEPRVRNFLEAHR